MTNLKPRDPSRGRRAKIICTLGPATDDVDVLRGLIRAGMDVARLNLSFGTVEEHLERVARFREVAAETRGRPVALVADLPGRKLRVRELEGGAVDLETGADVQFVADEGQVGDHRVIPVDPGIFHDGLMPGDAILLADGVVELSIKAVNGRSATAQVVFGGRVREHTGVHAPGMSLTGSAITERDLPYMKMAVEEQFDYVALSYVGEAADVVEIRERLADMGRDIPIIAKIERSEAFSRLDGILRRADAVMVRRGDLGAQIEVTRVPMVQKEILRLAGQAGKPAIVATQMLRSMVDNPRPTRAEASDVSNAIADGADGVLLSSETAIGAYPVEAVEMMSRIILETEVEGVPFRRAPPDTPQTVAAGFAHTTARIAVQAAARTKAKLIACFTQSGRTAQLVAKYRPVAPIIAFCLDESTRRRLSLTWGVRTDALDVEGDVEVMVRSVEERLLGIGLVSAGDRLVITFGAPVGDRGQTNSVRLHVVGGPQRESRSTPSTPEAQADGGDVFAP